MDLRLLRYFVAIVESQSISRAAQILGVAQPALSQHVSRMERDLGLPLLHRTSRGVTPTDGGKRLYASARSILALAAELPDFVRGAAQNPAGDVRVGMSGTVSELVGVPLLEVAKSLYPRIHIRLVEAMSGHILEWLKRGEVDIALVYATSDPKGLTVQHVLTEDLFLFGLPGGAVQTPAGGQVSPAQTAALKLILPGASHGLRKIVDVALAPVKKRLEPIFEVDSYNHIKRLVRSGEGYGILPQTAIAAEMREGVFDAWPIGPPRLRRRIYLTQSNERPPSSAAAAVASLCLRVAGTLVKDGVWIADLADPDHGVANAASS